MTQAFLFSPCSQEAAQLSPSEAAAPKTLRITYSAAAPRSEPQAWPPAASSPWLSASSAVTPRPYGTSSPCLCLPLSVSHKEGQGFVHKSCDSGLHRERSSRWAGSHFGRCACMRAFSISSPASARCPHRYSLPLLDACGLDLVLCASNWRPVPRWSCEPPIVLCVPNLLLWPTTLCSVWSSL